MIYIRNNIKNIVIGLLLILLVIAGILLYKMYNKEPDKIIEVRGKVIVADDTYVIVEARKDYVLSTIKGAYNVGDEIKFMYNELDSYEDSELVTVNSLLDEEIIKVNTEINQEKIVEDDNQKPLSTQSDIKNTNTNITKNNIESNLEEKDRNKTNNSSVKEDVKNEDNTSNDYSNAVPKEEGSLINTTNSEEDVISFLEEVENTENKTELKKGFITVVDFIFYNGEIKGYTFSELTDSAKLKVLTFALTIDKKIEEHLPNYKEEISDTAGRLYVNIKEKCLELYLDITTRICSNNTSLCTSAKENFNELKNSFGFTWDVLKDLAGSGVTKLKSWYEIWSGK